MRKAINVGVSGVLCGICCVILVAQPAAAAENRVLIIGIDGVGGSFLRDIDTPHIDAIIAKGAVRYDFLNEAALVDEPPSAYGASGVNWSTIVTGAAAANHGVSDNDFGGKRFDKVPHFFKYIKDHDPSLFTASIVNWEPINQQMLEDRYADLKREFADQPLDVEDRMVHETARQLLRDGNPSAVFLHFDQVDGAGHKHGWRSPEYIAALQTVDGLVGSIMAAIESRPGVASGAENWLVIITADHGGEGTAHRAEQGPICWHVPFVVSGRSVPPGTQLEQGTLRDVVPTALRHLGIDPAKLPLDGTVRGLASYGADRDSRGETQVDSSP